jgi:hypothetical protein
MKVFDFFEKYKIGNSSNLIGKDDYKMFFQRLSRKLLRHLKI